MLPIRLLLALCLLPLAAAPAFAGAINKCRGADGKVSYSDKPCAQDAKAEATRATGGTDLAGIKPQCPDQTLDWQGPDAIGDAVNAAELPRAQAEAYAGTVLGLAFGSARPERWRRSRRGDLHFCGVDPQGAPWEVVAGVGGEVVSFKNGAGQRLDRKPDPADPSMRLSGCSTLVTGCYSPTGSSLDQCVDAAPTCTALSTGPCCPQECKDAYRSARSAGTEPQPALHGALFGKPSCIPGLARALGEQ
jgi:hypothetical protein